MVGVPGKSKGCITCKKRRIKCDESKPTCKRCEKSGYACAGYNTGLTFLNKSSAPFRDETTTQSRVSVQYVNDTPVTVIPRIRTAAVPPELSLVAFQPDLCLSFLMSNFVWRTYGHGWLEQAAAAKLDPLSSQAVQALSSSFFGMSHHQDDIQLRGSMHYGKAISLLRPALADPTKPGVENLLIPILVLLMHASYEEDRGASIAHVRGLMMLLRVAGPTRFQQSTALKAFESARATLITTSIIARQPLFLDQEPWKTIPWALNPTAKSHQNRLLDILVDIPGFLHQDALIQSSEVEPTARANLLTLVQSRLYTLMHWRYVWEMLNVNAAYETRPTAARTIKQRIITRRLNFRTHEQAAEILLYNATHMWLFALLLRLSPGDVDRIRITAAKAALEAGFSDSFARGVLLLPDDVRTVRDLAVEIVRTFEFQQSSASNNQSSSLFFLFPLGIAYAVLENEPDYRSWIMDLLDQSPVTSGYAIGRNVWFGHYYMPKVFALRPTSEPLLVGVWKCPGCGEAVCKGGHGVPAESETG